MYPPDRAKAEQSDIVTDALGHARSATDMQTGCAQGQRGWRCDACGECGGGGPIRLDGDSTDLAHWLGSRESSRVSIAKFCSLIAIIKGVPGAAGDEEDLFVLIKPFTSSMVQVLLTDCDHQK